jgi:predicted ester cyclase
VAASSVAAFPPYLSSDLYTIERELGRGEMATMVEQSPQLEAAMAASTALESTNEVAAFIDEYFDAWRGTDVDRIMSYFDDDVTIHVPGAVMHGKQAVRDQFVQPFIAGFPGNRHIAQNTIFGPDVVVVEWNVVGEHSGSYGPLAPTGKHIDLPGCSVYEYNPISRRITAGRLYFDPGTLLKQIGAA